MQIWSTKEQDSLAAIDMKANVCCVKYNPAQAHQVPCMCHPLQTNTDASNLMVTRKNARQQLPICVRCRGINLCVCVPSDCHRLSRPLRARV